MDPKIFIVRKLAAKYHTEFIPLDGIFAELTIKSAPEKFSIEGIHLTPEGNVILAREWLKRITIKM